MYEPTTNVQRNGVFVKYNTNTVKYSSQEVAWRDHYYCLKKRPSSLGTPLRNSVRKKWCFAFPAFRFHLTAITPGANGGLSLWKGLLSDSRTIFTWIRSPPRPWFYGNCPRSSTFTFVCSFQGTSRHFDRKRPANVKARVINIKLDYRSNRITFEDGPRFSASALSSAEAILHARRLFLLFPAPRHGSFVTF